MRNNSWCISDIWENIAEIYLQDNPWMSEEGIGMSWANEWKNNQVTKYTNDRFRNICPNLGLEVWYYPIECFDSFKTWLEAYSKHRTKAMAEHKSQAPILPLEGYISGTRFDGKTAYFTGFYSEDKKTITNVIVPQTGIISETSFKKSTSFLIMGPNRGPAKIEKAKAAGIPCISVEVFVEEVTK